MTGGVASGTCTCLVSSMTPSRVTDGEAGNTDARSKLLSRRFCVKGEKAVHDTFQFFLVHPTGRTIPAFKNGRVGSALPIAKVTRGSLHA